MLFPTGSNQLKFWGLSSDGRAVALQASGQGFDPLRLHQHLIEPKLPINDAHYEGHLKCRIRGCSSVVEPFVANEAVESSNLFTRSIPWIPHD